MAVLLADEQQVEVDGPTLVALARHVLGDRRVPDEMELFLLLVDTSTIAELNRQHLDGDGPTDVLAFPIDEPGESAPQGPSILGDVVLCPEVAFAQSAELGRSGQQELEMLTVHGILHLLGMDHDDLQREQEMFGLTDALLTSFAAEGNRQVDE